MAGERRFKVDVGGRFASDAHRRVQATVPNPVDQEPLPEEEILKRLVADSHSPFGKTDGETLSKILGDLKAANFSEQKDGKWQNTEYGFETLTAPPPEASTVDIDE
jgi:hypothetical protein